MSSNKPIMVGVGFGDITSRLPLPASVRSTVKETFTRSQGAAKQGDDRAQLILGIAHEYGIHVDRDDSAAAYWYTQAANNGNLDAYCPLSLMYWQGRGVSADKHEAIAIIRSASKAGHPSARLFNAHMTIGSKCAAKDTQQAMDWLVLAAEDGLVTAQYLLGLLCSGQRGMPEDYIEAVRWYHMAASYGYGLAMNNLGALLEKGVVIPPEPELAVRWYREAARMNAEGAQCNLGRCYLHGTGVTQDRQRAIAWYRSAAAQGEECAQWRLVELGVSV